MRGLRPHVEFDKPKLNKLFKRLRKAGFVAKQNYLCCSSCAGYDLAIKYGKACDEGKGDKIQGYVFYNKQDTEGLNETGDVFLAYGQISYWDNEKNVEKYTGPLTTVQVGNKIKELCEELGIRYKWDGSERTRFHLGLGK